MDRATLTPIAGECAVACLRGLRTITVSLSGARPKGFPRGELLSVGTNGSHNYAIDPVKLLAWIRDTATKEQA